MFEQLTEKQREVLAMVADGRTSKEIARALGVSESAVNQRIESIRRIAAGAPRAELARMWREHSAGIPAPDATCKPLTGQSSHIPESPVIGHEPPAGWVPVEIATTFAPVPGSHRPATDRSSIVPAALDGPQGTFHRIALVAVMAAAILLLTLSGLSIVENLTALTGGKNPGPAPHRLVGKAPQAG